MTEFIIMYLKIAIPISAIYALGSLIISLNEQPQIKVLYQDKDSYRWYLGLISGLLFIGVTIITTALLPLVILKPLLDKIKEKIKGGNN